MNYILSNMTILFLIIISSFALLLLLVFVFIRIGRLRRRLEEAYQDNMTVSSIIRNLSHCIGYRRRI